MLAFFRKIHQRLLLLFVHWFRTREVLQVLRVMHVQELAEVQINEWALIKNRQALDIQAVKKGNYNVIDRRSWQYPYIPEALHRLNQPILKNTPYNLRRFLETPIPRRAINIIKNGVLSFDWEIRARDRFNAQDPDILRDAEIMTDCFENPNNQDSYRTLMEAVIEDFTTGGYGTIEPQLTPDYERPIKMWAVDGATIRIYANWSEATPDLPHYAQLTGLKGERGIITFLDDELCYIRDNVRSSTPFGLGCGEVAFNTINAFLGAQDMSSRAGADQIHKTMLWWKESLPPGNIQTIQRHIQNEAEGQAKLSIISGVNPPQVVDVNPVKAEDLLLEWQTFTLRIIAAAFNLSAMALQVENDVNRSTSDTLSEMDFQNAIVPVARKIEEALTRFIIHRIVGWKEIEFAFIGLDDPDAQVQAEIFTMFYNLNAIVPDEIRKASNLGPPLPGGWGRLTKAQMALLIAQATGKPPGGINTLGSGGGSSGGFGSPSMGASAANNLSASPFQAEDVARMSPQDVNTYQQHGMLPPSGPLQQQMNEEQPGILETLSEELREYFEKEEEIEEENRTKATEVSPQDEKKQAKRYKQSLHDLLPEEAWARYIERHRVIPPSAPFAESKQQTIKLKRNARNNMTTIRGPKSGGYTGRFR